MQQESSPKANHKWFAHHLQSFYLGGFKYKLISTLQYSLFLIYFYVFYRMKHVHLHKKLKHWNKTQNKSKAASICLKQLSASLLLVISVLCFSSEDLFAMRRGLTLPWWYHFYYCWEYSKDAIPPRTRNRLAKHVARGTSDVPSDSLRQILGGCLSVLDFFPVKSFWIAIPLLIFQNLYVRLRDISLNWMIAWGPEFNPLSTNVNGVQSLTIQALERYRREDTCGSLVGKCSRIMKNPVLENRWMTLRC